MKLHCLGSSSSGNCYLLENDTECLVIECGVKFLEVKKVLNFNIQKTVGCIISHCHFDHSKYASDLLSAGINIYTNADTVQSIKTDFTYLIHSVQEKVPFMVGGFRITPFYVPHDETPCFAYRIEHEDIGILLFLTDLEYCKYRFKDVNHIMIEANYSKEILNQDCPNNDHIIKGHMEINNTKEFVVANDNTNLMNTILLHLSDRNSNEKQFLETIQSVVPYSNVYAADKGMQIELKQVPF